MELIISYARMTKKSEIKCPVYVANYKNDQDSIITAEDWQLGNSNYSTTRKTFFL